MELFSWDGFYSDSISVKDSLVRELTRLHAGFLALDPRTGAVRAWVGGIDFRKYPYDQIFAQRQIASAFKPVLYAAALESGIRPCQYLDNAPLVFTDLNNWSPQNYDKSLGGKYSVSAALAHSMNIPSINLFLGLPFNNIQKTWTNLGFSHPLEANPSTALGTANASIYELAIAYSAFANGGKRIRPGSVVTVKTAEGKIIYEDRFTASQERVLTKETSLLMTAMLQKAVREGTGRALAGQYGIQMDVAGKTGTSQDYADAWFAAYNKHLVLVTRVGCNLPTVHFNSGTYGSGGALALPLVGLTLKEIQKSPSLRKK
ncbi:MAG: penicillin-binding transpeptidase domain-containing protein [Flavobacteriaceae bacterium]|nr:penicillin-binding transpeptidase domain-containing protein [Flavobacteriaceae bacterium]